MAQFIALRLLHTILILFGVSIVAFGLIHLIPGNPLDILLPPEAPKEVVERLKVEFGFDKPLYIQYFAWLGRVLHGNLGTSVFTGLQVTGELLSALGNTFVLAVPAALLGFSLGTTLGTLAAFNHGRLLDKVFSVVDDPRAQHAALLARHRAGHRLRGAVPAVAGGRHGRRGRHSRRAGTRRGI